MAIERLLAAGSIHPFAATSEEVDRAMHIARRDLHLAEAIVAESLDWSYSIAYNAILQASRAYMFHRGYRPASFEAHKATFEFMRAVLDEPWAATVDYFDRARKKRHRTIYDEAGTISEKEAKRLLNKARDFLSYVEEAVKR